MLTPQAEIGLTHLLDHLRMLFVLGISLILILITIACDAQAIQSEYKALALHGS
jgi:formate hydrogenlyase subunit 3/multisubunit Na+/H+ antiporter MnhD subunit